MKKCTISVSSGNSSAILFMINIIIQITECLYATCYKLLGARDEHGSSLCDVSC